MTFFYFCMEAIIYSAPFFSSIGGGVFCFTVGYTYANIVRYRSDHGGDLDFIEVVREMTSIKSDSDDLDVERILEENVESVESLGTEIEFI